MFTLVLSSYTFGAQIRVTGFVFKKKKKFNFYHDHVSHGMTRNVRAIGRRLLEVGFFPLVGKLRMINYFRVNKLYKGTNPQKLEHPCQITIIGLVNRFWLGRARFTFLFIAF